MNIPCTQRLFFIVTGLSFLQPALTNIQFNNLTLVATALVLGSGFSLTSISRMWLKERCVSTLSYFFTDAQIRISEKILEHLGLWAEMPSRDPPPLTQDSQEEVVYEPFDDGWPGLMK